MSENKVSSSSKVKLRLMNDLKLSRERTIHAFVLSKSITKDSCSFSCVIDNGEWIKFVDSISCFNCDEDIGVLGIIQAMMYAISYSITNGYDKVLIHYQKDTIDDLEAYLSGNSRYANYYIKFLQNVKSFINVGYFFDKDIKQTGYVICNELIELKLNQ